MSYNPNLSPTALLVAIASDFRDAAMKDAYEAEGTAREAEADAAYKAAEEAYKAASAAHRAAVEDSMKCGAARYGTGDNTHLCVKQSRHIGDHRTAEGDKFTNWFD